MVAVNWSMTLIMYLDKNNSMNYTTQCVYDVALFLRYAGTLTVVLGFLGNFLSIIVFSRKTLRSRSCSMYFLSLSMSDICVLFGYTFENLLSNGYNIQLLSNTFMCKAIIFLIYASTDISNYLLTLAAIDRCVLVSHRTAHYRFCRKSVAKVFIIFIILLFSLINSHFLYGFHIDQNEACLPGSMEYSYFYAHHYDSYIDIIKTVLIPFIIILTCNAFIIVRLTRKKSLLSTRSRHRNRRRQEKDRQLTCFLLLTSVLFIILSLPSEINDYLRTHFTPQFQIEYACQLWIITTITILLHQINHASHFYVYTLTGPIFRKEFQKVICLYRHKSSSKKELSAFSRKQSTTTRGTHHDETNDDHRLSILLKQTHSVSRVSFKFNV